MTYNSQANKRIAKNTLVVYVQLLFRMFLGLYTSRLALEALGVSDFGLYSVVAGVVMLLMFVSGSLYGTTIRYINVERGKADGNLCRVFNVCHVLHIGAALILFIILEVCGVFYINNFLNVEIGKEADAMFAFQAVTFVSCIGIVNVPFASLFNANENFLFTAVVELSVKVVQLVLLFWLLTYEGNRLRAYALMETLTLLTTFVVYHIYWYHRKPDIVRWRFVKEWSIYKEMVAFTFYNLMSAIAGIARGQGSLLLINYFFGTVVNGAFAVAKTIERNISPFANNFHGAAAPQITQSYSCGDMERVFFLTSRIAKYCMLMMVLAFFPLWAELDFILHVWLVKVPEGALVFSQMILLLVFVTVTDGGLGHVINASGKVSKFKTVYSLITLSCLPIGFIVLRAGFPAYTLLIVLLLADLIWRIIQIRMMYSILHFPILKYCREAYLPVLYTVIPIILCMIITSQVSNQNTLWHLSHIAIILSVTLLSIYCCGLNKDERQTILFQIVQRITPHAK